MNDFRVEQGPENLYSQELTDYVDQSIKDEEIFHYFGFEYLHRLNIVSLQNQLITLRESIAAGTHNRDQDPDRLKRLLSDYSKLPMVLSRLWSDSDHFFRNPSNRENRAQPMLYGTIITFDRDNEYPRMRLKQGKCV
jgi:hypothetical protein